MNDTFLFDLMWFWIRITFNITLNPIVMLDFRTTKMRTDILLVMVNKTTKWLILVLSQNLRYPQRPIDTNNNMLSLSFHLRPIMMLYCHFTVWVIGQGWETKTDSLLTQSTLKTLPYSSRLVKKVWGCRIDSFSITLWRFCGHFG
jgi:hypothetical protein